MKIYSCDGIKCTIPHSTSNFYIVIAKFIISVINLSVTALLDLRLCQHFGNMIFDFFQRRGTRFGRKVNKKSKLFIFISSFQSR